MLQPRHERRRQTGTGPSFPLTINARDPGLLAPSSFKDRFDPVCGWNSGRWHTYAIPTGAPIGRPVTTCDVRHSLHLSRARYVCASCVRADPQANSDTTGQRPRPSTLRDVAAEFLATVLYGGLAPATTIHQSQFIQIVPHAAAGNTVPMTFSLAGTPGTQTLNIAVSN